MERGWGGGLPPLSETFGAQAMDASWAPAQQEEIHTLQSYILRVLLGAAEPVLLPQLRQLALGARNAADSSSRSKCLLELALGGLSEQGLVVRQGYGALTALSVPDAALPKAEALAYSEFPDEGQLPLYGSAAAAAALGPAPVHACPPSRLNRVRRLSSPRQFGRMTGIEKASGGRRGKRSIADDMGQLQLVQKRLRLPDGSSFGSAFGADTGAGFGSGGVGGWGVPSPSSGGGSGGSPFGSEGMAMSP